MSKLSIFLNFFSVYVISSQNSSGFQAKTQAINVSIELPPRMSYVAYLVHQPLIYAEMSLYTHPVELSAFSQVIQFPHASGGNQFTNTIHQTY